MARGYARFCTTMSPGVPAGQRYRDNVKQQTDAAKRVVGTDDLVARTVQQRLKLGSPPVVVARQIQRGYESANASGSEVALLSNMDASKPLWWQATLKRDGSLVDVVSAPPDFVKRSIGFPRFMAAYVLFNDLEGGDEPYPSEGCRALFNAWFGLFPAVTSVTSAALVATPKQDPKVIASVRRSWNDLGHGNAGVGIMRATIAQVGPDPEIRSVYHDAGLPGDGVGIIDVVRIGGAKHTYAIVSSTAGYKISDEQPLCVVGDARCAEYYVWP